MSEPVEGIYELESPYLGVVRVGIASGRVISVSFPDVASDDSLHEHELLGRIDSYLDGIRVDFSNVEVALTVPTEHRNVLETVRGIPYGNQVSVQELANMTPQIDPEDDDALDETVRIALAENPVPLILPDHRVRDGPSSAPSRVEQRLRSIEGL
jgi:methylated-DNA-[protein]-cysteine S-methyltransferase